MILKVKEIKKEIKDIFSVIFEKPKGFNFYPGQYLDYELPIDDPDGNTRAFTISSSPTEDFLMLSTRYGHTPFKKHLAKLKIGHEVKTSHPAGTFILDESSPAVFIAGGIGITPFRSMIKYVFDQKLLTPIALIYSNSDNNFLFKDEFHALQKDNPKLDIIYYNSTSGRLTKLPISNSIYYLAGSHSFVSDIEKILIESGINQTNIRYDRFDGYK